jgi:hypothetical protein
MTVIRIEGEAWLSLEAISECYECELSWVREVYDAGLLGAGRTVSGEVVLRVTVLDRVADIVRLSRYQGLGLETIVALIGTAPERGPRR